MKANEMKLKYGYLDQQFQNVDHIFEDLKKWVPTTEYTIGPFVEAFEKKFAEYLGVKHVLGTNTGTDALILSLKAAGIKPGDEVITVANTFYATAGAIVAAGAKPVFVDCDARYSIDVTKIEKAITAKTTCLLPVHWGGMPCDIESVMTIAQKHGLKVVEDACQAAGSTVKSKKVGTFGDFGAFSMHPVKPLNVWGDAGMLCTNNSDAYAWLKLYRNHGMVDRDHIDIWGVNSRIQPFQAIVGSHVLDTLEGSIARRIEVGKALDAGLGNLEPMLRLPYRPAEYREMYQLYMVTTPQRDGLVKHLRDHAIDAKVHYPIPLHLQKPAREMGYKEGDFPVAERQAHELLTLPSHQFLSDEDVSFIVATVRSFFASR